MEDQPRPDSIASVILINYPPKRSEFIASICLETKRQQDKETKDRGGFGFDAAIQCLKKLFLKPAHLITSRILPALLTSLVPKAAGRAPRCPTAPERAEEQRERPREIFESAFEKHSLCSPASIRHFLQINQLL